MANESGSSYPKTKARAVLSKYIGQLSGIFAHHREGVLIADLSGEIVMYNESQSRIDGIKPEDAIGRTICEVYNIAPSCSPTMNVLRTGKPTFDDVHFYQTRSGNLINSSCHIYPLFLEDIFCGALSFISEYSFLELEALNPSEKIPLMSKSPGKEIALLKFSQKKESYRFANIIGKSPLLQEAVQMAKYASTSPSSIMLIGETGVGKEMFARSIHAASQRCNAPFTPINCSAIPETLLEGILFGTAKGAYTGAIDKPGLLEISNEGTVFFDEVDSMPLSLQSKLLRFLQDFRFRRVGDTCERQVDLKIISAVGRTPRKCIEAGELRKDLFYRLGVVQVAIPPLRERMEDLPLLSQFFITKHSKLLHIDPPRVHPQVMAILYSYSWPGNVREFEHAIEACLNMAAGKTEIGLMDLKRMCPELYALAMCRLVTDKVDEHNDIPISIRCSLQDEDGIYLDCCVEQGEEHAEIQKTNRQLECGAVLHNSRVKERCSEELPRNGLIQKRKQVERKAICDALRRAGGNKSLAGRLLGISPQLIAYKIKRLSIDADEFIPRNEFLE